MCVPKYDSDWESANGGVLRLLYQMVFISFSLSLLPSSLVGSVGLDRASSSSPSTSMIQFLDHLTYVVSLCVDRFCSLSSLYFFRVAQAPPTPRRGTQREREREWKNRTTGLVWRVARCHYRHRGFFFLIRRSWLIREKNERRKTINDSAAFSLRQFFSRSYAFSPSLFREISGCLSWQENELLDMMTFLRDACQ